MERDESRQEVAELSIYDTLSRQIRPIRQSGLEEVRIYCCGPTVYRDAHVGNLRTFLLTDLVHRTLLELGKKVHIVQNITDVGHMTEEFEDKLLEQSKSEGRDPFTLARDYEAKFHQDLAALNIIPAREYPRASESIELMIALIESLFERDIAYKGDDGSIYYSAEKYLDYGQLSGNRLDSLKPGLRYDISEAGVKRFHADWSLWKSAGNRKEMVWETPWGLGFPGWHIECSAMSLHYLEGKVDLHIGGIDLRFPHHENERAQSNVLQVDPSNQEEVVSLWLHGEHLLFEGRKMSKSSGNVVLLKDIKAAGFDPLSLRLCFMENRYRSQMDLSWSGIRAADSTLQRWRRKYQEWLEVSVGNHSSQVEIAYQNILKAFCEDLDTPRALILFRAFEKSQELSNAEKISLFEKVEALFGLQITRNVHPVTLSREIEDLLMKRKLARQEKNYQLSDSIREELSNLGVMVEDTPRGQVWNLITENVETE
jgi:cysteinyl-tRNA synthetase